MRVDVDGLLAISETVRETGTMGQGRSRCGAAVLIDLFLELRVRESVQRSRQARRTRANIKSGWQQRPTRLLYFDRF
jgi:hypothetical protein